MGCCFSSEDDKDTLTNEPDETTRLINPVQNHSPRSVGPSSEPAIVSHPKGDEHSALERILQKTARDVIDVTNESNLVEQTEYQERTRQYSNRVNMVVGGSSRLKQKPNLPNCVTAPQSVLASKPISLHDIQLITNATEKASRCIKEIKVQHKENLVVPFGVP
ncbi:ragulator complex protein LAMTOR1-like isoform X2 [Mytilus galloprovincialis]|uniref:Ragulator complex protein LAMTOR1 n=2 Tax=Mytilus TaxID=6548 RepID=A0A8B6EW21_MYTGA|nr:LAMTOR1 [Mytilus edulis]VDI40916.1 ragulator complex protein LAMTOR1 [Mytilus galloprovincialis]